MRRGQRRPAEEGKMPYVGGAWSSPESDLEPGPFCSVCLIDMNPPGAEKTKEKCYLPIRKKPGGPIYTSAIRAALGGHGLLRVQGVSAEKKRAAAKALVRHAGAAGIEVTSQAILKLAGRKPG